MEILGPIQCELDGQFAVTVTKFSVDGDTPTTFKAGAQGPIGIAQGVEKPSGSIVFAIPKTGLEFDIMGVLTRPEGFTFGFPLGAERHVIMACKRNKRGVSSTMESGDSEFTFAFIG